jgi:hypothetical protein
MNREIYTPDSVLLSGEFTLKDLRRIAETLEAIQRITQNAKEELNSREMR